jgi:hypothetical protein
MLQRQSRREFKGHVSNEKHMPIPESGKEDPGWPSFGQLIADLSKLSLEALTSAFTQFIPSHFKSDGPKAGLTPLKDRLVMPEDEAVPPLVNRKSTPVAVTENRQMPQVHTPTTAEKYSEVKPPKIKSSSFKDPALSSKHRSSKRSEYAEFYGSGEVPSYAKSKSQKERTKHRHREKSGEVAFAKNGPEAKPVEPRPAVDHSNSKFDRYSMRTSYVPGESFRFNSQ